MREDYIEEYNEIPPNQIYDEIQSNSIVNNLMRQSSLEVLLIFN